MKPLVIATRRSALALWQAHHVGGRLAALSGRPYQLLEIVTKGDKILDVPLAKVGGKGLFVKEIEEALLDGRADLAVHSLKDVPTQRAPGLVLGAIPEREDPRDAVCSPRFGSFEKIPLNGKIGTSSLRRGCQLKALRPDLEVVSIRGNVATRLAKADEALDAVVLAYAGLKRLGLGEKATQVLPVETSLPAIGQGALAIELRSEAARMILMSDTLHLRVSAGQVVGAVAILTGLTTLATFGPAYRASRMRPITAIHHIG